MSGFGSPSAEDVRRFLRQLREGRERLRLLARDIPGESADEFADAIDQIAEQMLVADEELRVQSEQLEQSSRRLDLLVAVHEELFTAAPTPYLETDADGVIVRYNRAARRLLNLPPVSTRTLTLTGLVRNADRHAVRNLLSRLRSGEPVAPFTGRAELLEVTVVTGSGGPTPVVLSGRRSSDAGTGQPLLHWELQPAGLRAPSAALDPSAAPPADREAVRTLAAAATDLAEQQTPAATLEHVATQALRAVPGCEEVGVTVVRSHGRIDTPACTGELSAVCDQLQYELNEGPCLGAVGDSRPIRVTDMATETRWPQFAPRAAQLGVGSMLAVPLSTPRGVLGALNFYAKAPEAFDDDDVLVAQAYATHAGIALAHAELEANLRIGLRTREEIGRAVGILMERHRATATAAFDMLVVASQHSQRKLRDIAAWVNETGEDPAKYTPLAPRRDRRGSVAG
jgi:PAS domain-containing protein